MDDETDEVAVGMTARGRVRAGIAASAVALVTLTGCANASPGVAAYVNDTKITDRQLTSAVAGISSTLEEGQQVSAPAVLNAMIHGAIADQLAAKNAIVITDSQRDALLKGSNLAGLVTVPAARPVAYDVADQEIVSKTLGAQAYLTATEAQRVTVNPRYGVLDRKQKLIITDQSGSLANPAITPTPQVPQ